MAVDDRGARALATPAPASLRYAFPGNSAEIIYGTARAETLTGDEGGQWLFGLGGSDRLFGEGGNDYFDGGGGDDRFDGGEGSDTLLYTVNSTPVRVNFAGGLVSFPGKRWAGEAFTGIENVHTGSGGDVVLGDAFANAIFTHEGRDLLRGGGGGDALDGGGGSDRLYGDGGKDKLLGGGGDDALHGGDGDDILDGGDGDDRFDGGRGSDTVLYALNTSAVRVNLGSGVVAFPGQTWAAEALVSVENVVTGTGDDWIIGNRAANAVTTGSGDDYVNTGGGNDRIETGDGDDWLLGGSGDDRLEGGDGNDRLYGGQGADVLVGGTGRDFLNGGAGTDTAVYLEEEASDYHDPYGAGPNDVTADLAIGIAYLADGTADFQERILDVENIITGWGNDFIIGSAADNVIRVNGGANLVNAGAGDDRIFGGEWSDLYDVWRGHTFDDSLDFSNGYGDLLNGGSGDDVIFSGGARMYRPGGWDEAPARDVLNGGRGNDILVAGHGNVTLTGGVGADHFRFSTEVTEVWDGGRGEYYAGQAVSVTDYDADEGDELLIRIVNEERPVYAGYEVEHVGEYGFYRDGDDLHVRYILAEELEWDDTPYLVELDITLAGYTGRLTQDDILFI